MSSVTTFAKCNAGNNHLTPQFPTFFIKPKVHVKPQTNKRKVENAKDVWGGQTFYNGGSVGRFRHTASGEGALVSRIQRGIHKQTGLTVANV